MGVFAWPNSTSHLYRLWGKAVYEPSGGIVAQMYIALLNSIYNIHDYIFLPTGKLILLYYYEKQ